MGVIAKPKKIKLSTLRNKCDRLLQEVGRDVYDRCLVCGNPVSCLHHYHPKSMSQTLRYYWPNLIPLCVSCHFTHHNGNPLIHEAVLRMKGEDWSNDLWLKKKEITKPTKQYYQAIIENLEKIRITKGKRW